MPLPRRKQHRGHGILHQLCRLASRRPRQRKRKAPRKQSLGNEAVRRWQVCTFSSWHEGQGIDLLWCPTMVSYYGVLLWCPTMVSYYGVLLWCPTMVSYYGVLLWSPTMVSYNGVLLRCPTMVSYYGVLLWCPTMVSDNGVLLRCPVCRIADVRGVLMLPPRPQGRA